MKRSQIQEIVDFDKKVKILQYKMHNIDVDKIAELVDLPVQTVKNIIKAFDERYRSLFEKTQDYYSITSILRKISRFLKSLETN